MARLTGGILVCCLLLAAAPAAAPEPLSAARVEAWLAVVAALEGAGEPVAGAPLDEPEAALAALRQRAVEHERLLRQHGFDRQAFEAVGARVLDAFVLLQLREHAERHAADRERVRLEIEHNPHLSEQQKAALSAQLEVMQQLAATLPVPAADLEAVRPHRARLQRLFSD